MIRTIAVCDDEAKDVELAVEALRKLESEMNDRYQILVYHNGERLLQDIEKEQQLIDTVFLDIEMKTLNGIDIAEKINQMQPHCNIVYLTNYLQYATDVYRTDHHFFILKSELNERIYQVREKTERLMEEQRNQIVVPLYGNKQIVLKKADIHYIERNERRTKIFATDQVYVTKLKLDEVEQILGKSQFVRCHNSFIVGFRYITSYRREMLKVDGIDIPISRRYQPIAREGFIKWSKEHVF